MNGKIVFTNDRTLSSSKILKSFFSENLDENQKILSQLKSKFDMAYINKQLEKVKLLKVSIIGEIILDKYIFCETVGKSGKEPHLVLKELSDEKYLGGSGAIANNIALFSQNINLISYIGKKITKSISSKKIVKQGKELIYRKKIHPQ